MAADLGEDVGDVLLVLHDHHAGVGQGGGHRPGVGRGRIALADRSARSAR